MPLSIAAFMWARAGSNIERFVLQLFAATAALTSVPSGITSGEVGAVGSRLSLSVQAATKAMPRNPTIAGHRRGLKPIIKLPYLEADRGMRHSRSTGPLWFMIWNFDLTSDRVAAL